LCKRFTLSVKFRCYSYEWEQIKLLISLRIRRLLLVNKVAERVGTIHVSSRHFITKVMRRKLTTETAYIVRHHRKGAAN
jgi:hypothetical protein